MSHVVILFKRCLPSSSPGVGALIDWWVGLGITIFYALGFLFLVVLLYFRSFSFAYFLYLFLAISWFLYLIYFVIRKKIPIHFFYKKKYYQCRYNNTFFNFLPQETKCNKYWIHILNLCLRLWRGSVRRAFEGEKQREE
jgi:hypothetical protein